MSTRAERIFRCLSNEKVPLSLSIQLLARLESVELQDIACQAKCARSLLYMALAGDRRAPERLRQAFIDAMGIDPWADQKQ